MLCGSASISSLNLYLMVFHIFIYNTIAINIKTSKKLSMERSLSTAALKKFVIANNIDHSSNVAPVNENNYVHYGAANNNRILNYVTNATVSEQSTSDSVNTRIGALDIKDKPEEKGFQPALHRAKRFLAFPEGSSLSVAVCFTVGIIGNPRYNYMAFGLNWGVGYDLPNITWVLNHLHGFSTHSTGEGLVYRRRSRRSFYKELEIGLDYMGFNGRDCILRALCESNNYFKKIKMGMVGEMLRVIFSLPKQRILSREIRESSDILAYDRAYRTQHIASCEEQYDCKFSLLELAFGKYSEPPVGYLNNK